MKKIKALRLYPDALDLYGDSKNLTVLGQRLHESGAELEIAYNNGDEDISLDGVDMVYISHGKARNLAHVWEHFHKNGDKIVRAIENGTLFLVTGNAQELFGRTFSDTSGSFLEGLGLFRYDTIEDNSVQVSDMLLEPVFAPQEKCYGFMNRTAHMTGEHKYPLFKVISGVSDDTTQNHAEGTLYKNYFGTWAMGPVLARNPVLMREILRRLLGEDYRELDFSLEEQALSMVLSEFKVKQ